MNGQPFPQAFFDQPADRVARELLGASLVVRAADGRLTRHMVFETEAYLGAHDLACHGSRGKTQRNATSMKRSHPLHSNNNAQRNAIA